MMPLGKKLENDGMVFNGAAENSYRRLARQKRRIFLGRLVRHRAPLHLIQKATIWLEGVGQRYSTAGHEIPSQIGPAQIWPGIKPRKHYRCSE
jgi:hypothetical protein